MIINTICPQFIYFCANNVPSDVFSEKKHFPKINDIIKPIQKRLNIKKKKLKMYFSVILNKYFSEGFDTLVKSSSVNILSKYDSLV